MFMVTGGPANTVGPSGVRERLARRRADRESYVFAYDLALRWRRTAEGTAVARTSPCVAGGVVVSVPTLVAVDLGPPVVLALQLLPGQLAADVAAVAARLAEGMGVASVRVQPWHYGYVKATLLPVDPLAVPAQRRVVDAHWALVDLGCGEDGRPVRLDPVAAAHVVVQGATRSGKSTGLYGVLAQLADVPHVQVTGCDPTGLLLGPWTGRSGPIPPTVGTGNPAAHVAVLEALTTEMDARILAIRPGRDAVDIDEQHPLIVVLMEEYAGLLRVLDGHDKTLGRLARAAVARLLSEGAKAGIRVILVCQRADATIIGGFERGQASHTLSFRVGPDAVKMLHPDVPADVVAEHAVAPNGVALLSAPGLPLLRFRAPMMPYADYVAAVQRSTR